jgi:phage host-nuclease inhibitor protein Gam
MQPGTERIEQDLLAMWAESPTPDQELLAEIVREHEACDPGPCRNADEAILARYLKGVKRREAELKEIEANHATRVTQLKRAMLDHAQRYAQEAEEACRRLLSGSKRKSYTTDHGTASFKWQPVALAVADEAAIPAEFMRTKTEVLVDKLAINDYFERTKEVVPGCELTGGCDKFHIAKSPKLEDTP